MQNSWCHISEIVLRHTDVNSLPTPKRDNLYSPEPVDIAAGSEVLSMQEMHLNGKKTYDAFRVVAVSPQVYPTGPGVQVSSPHTLSATLKIEHPENVPSTS